MPDRSADGAARDGEPADAWTPELEELARRRAHADRLGGSAGVERQHAAGKLTVLERVDRLVDAGTFRRFGELRGDAIYDDAGQLVDLTPVPRVEGTAEIAGRRVLVVGDDFTVRGGSLGDVAIGVGSELSAPERALAWRLPLIRLLDSAGGSVKSFEGLGRTYLPDGNTFSRVEVELLGVAPIVSAVLGSVAGLPALQTALSHFSVMTRTGAQVFPGGPPVVRAATGVEITKEELGGPDVHVRESGVVDNLADDEVDALRQLRRVLSYLPSSVDELPPVEAAVDPPSTATDLRSLIPREVRQPYDVRRAIHAIVDAESFVEIGRFHGRSRVTGLARVGGYAVGVMASNTLALGGATDVAAAAKATRFIQLCDQFHLPLIDLADEPGLMVGLEAERRGIERAGARLVCAVLDSRVPYLVFVLRRLYGVGGQTHHRPSGMFRRYCWPSATWGSMPILGGAAAAYRREIAASPDPEAKRVEIEQRLERLTSPFRTAEATGQEIIDPRISRDVALEFVGDAQRLLARQLGPPPRPYRP